MITKKAEYAITTLTELAKLKPGEQITTREIARRRNIPINLIVQLVSTLRDAGWVASTRGPGGGIMLACNPDHISLRQVIELYDGPISITRCLLQDGPCHNQVECSLRGVWAEAQEKMLEVLEGVTIKKLAEADRKLRAEKAEI
ncbi:MAG TPA: Rrf2 family transcriptional regulator [Bacillota bacterium]|nr:Rrf2 family transcriptional regulator [Bacillota bacterium]